MEWAPPGTWEKAYDFIGPQSEPGGAVLYLDPGPAAEAGPAPASSAAAPPVEREIPRREAPAAPAADVTDAADAFAGRRLAALAPAGGGWMGAPSLPDLFPGADWLR